MSRLSVFKTTSLNNQLPISQPCHVQVGLQRIHMQSVIHHRPSREADSLASAYKLNNSSTEKVPFRSTCIHTRIRCDLNREPAPHKHKLPDSFTLEPESLPSLPDQSAFSSAGPQLVPRSVVRFWLTHIPQLQSLPAPSEDSMCSMQKQNHQPPTCHHDSRPKQKVHASLPRGD